MLYTVAFAFIRTECSGRGIWAHETVGILGHAGGVGMPSLVLNCDDQRRVGYPPVLCRTPTPAARDLARFPELHATPRDHHHPHWPRTDPPHPPRAHPRAARPPANNQPLTAFSLPFIVIIQGVTKVSDPPRKSTDEFYILTVTITAVIEPICVFYSNFHVLFTLWKSFFVSPIKYRFKYIVELYLDPLFEGKICEQCTFARHHYFT